MEFLKRFSRYLQSGEGTLNKKFVRAIIHSGLANASIHILSLVRSIILARLLFPEDFGILASATIFVKLVDTLTQTGLSTALIQRQDDFDENSKTVFTLNIIRGLFLFAIIYNSSGLISRFYGVDQLSGIVKVLSFSIIAKSLRNINIIKLQKELDYRKIATLSYLVETINFVISITLAYTIRNSYALAVSILSGHLIDSILSHCIIESKLKIGMNIRMAKELFKFGRFISGIAILVFATTEVDNFVVGKMLGMEVLGVYVIAYTIANLPCTHIVNTLSTVITPAYCKMQNDKERFIATYLKVLRTILIIIIPASTGLFMLSDETISILYGSKWAQAGPLVGILVLFGALRAIASTTGPVFIALGKPQIPFYLILYKLTAICITIVPATYLFGITGTCWTITLTMLAEQIALWSIVCKELSIRLHNILHLTLKPLTSSSIMAAYIFAMKNTAFAQTKTQYVFMVLSGATLYASSFIIFFNTEFKTLKKDIFG